MICVFCGEHINVYDVDIEVNGKEEDTKYVAMCGCTDTEPCATCQDALTEHMKKQAQ